MLFFTSKINQKKRVYASIPKKKEEGFTLLELLVAFSLFILIIGGVLGGVGTAVRTQSYILEKQAAVEEVSFSVDYISRALRGAKRDNTGTCITAGKTFETAESSSDWNRVRFIDRNNRCREFIRQNIPAVGGQGRISERISTDNTSGGLGGNYNSSTGFPGAYHIVSNDFSVQSFSVFDKGSDTALEYIQPSVGFSLHIADNPPTTSIMDVQTTVTARTLDVQ